MKGDGNNMVLGFTGTQMGLSKEQADALAALVAELRPAEVRHGDCVGADTEFHVVCGRLGIPIVIHPSSRQTKRSYNRNADNIMPAKDSLTRNRDIVDASDTVLACPSGMQEMLRSGTWSTVRYARKTGKRVIIVFPDGNHSWDIHGDLEKAQALS